MASTKRIVRKALVEILQSETATFDQRIKAARMLTKLLGLAEPGSCDSPRLKPRTGKLESVFS
jgi:hypothetical protein